MKLWGTHSDARMGEGVRWLAEVVLPSVDAAAKFHAKCCHSARKPPVFHDAFLLMDGSYSLNRTRLQALKTRFPSWLHIFTSRAAAADGAKRVLLDQRRCEWLTFVRLDADDMLTQEAFERIEQSASVSKGDVTVHGAGLLDMVTLYDEGKSLQCEHESRRRNFQMSQGQSVSLEASLWRSLRAPYEVHGNHVHLAEVWERRLGTLNKGSPAEAPRHRVHTVAVEKPAIYLRTLLSGLFVKERLARLRAAKPSLFSWVSHKLFPRHAPAAESSGCKQVRAKIGRAEAGLLLRARPPALTDREAREVCQPGMGCWNSQTG